MDQAPGKRYWAVDVEIEGLVEQLDRIKKFDRKTYDALVSELEDAGQDIEKESRNRIPSGSALRNWGNWTQATRATRRKSGVVVIRARSELRPVPFEGGAARAGIQSQVGRRYRKGRMLSAAVRVVQKDAAGAIWELAGSDNTNWGATGGGATFRDNLNSKYPAGGKWPRSLGPAWTANVDKARKRIDETIAKYAAEASGD